MVSFRFCRPDDLPLIMEAFNACYISHFENEHALDMTSLQQLVQELNIWASSCMVATEDDQPVGILLGARREQRTFVQAIGVKAEFQRQGIGSHMLQSLSDKLAILGPPLIFTELREREPEILAFFEKNGFQPTFRMVDHLVREPLNPLPTSDAVQIVSLEDLTPFREEFRATQDYPWQRAWDTLQNRDQQLTCLALISGDRIEAYLVYRTNPMVNCLEIVRFGSPIGERGKIYQTLLLRYLCQPGNLPVYIPRLTDAEIAFSHLRELGFLHGKVYWQYRKKVGEDAT